jgi:equilibrative nucleoside transporter 1/2/3
MVGGVEGGAAVASLPGGAAVVRQRTRALSLVTLDGLAILSTFAVTLAVFPTITALIRPLGLSMRAGAAGPEGVAGVARAPRGRAGETSSGGGTSSMYASLFTPTLFVLFNLGDLLGRGLAGLVPVTNGRRLLLLSSARLLFVPLFLACALGSQSHHRADGSAAGGGLLLSAPAASVASLGDTPALALLLLLGMTNGYCASCGFTAAPDRVEEGDKEWVGRAMPLFLNVGLTIGSLFALALERVLE